MSFGFFKFKRFKKVSVKQLTYEIIIITVLQFIKLYANI